MYITKLHIESFGNIISETFYLEKHTSILKTNFCDEIVAALKLILGCSSKVYYLKKSSIIKAEFIADSNITVEYFGGELKAYNQQGEDITEDYLNIMSHNSEEDSLNVFQHFRKQKYPHRLLKYKDIDRYYGKHDFRNITDGYGITRSFRAFLNEYIRDFQPIKINNAKDYYIHLLPSGEFIVKYKDDTVTHNLSESESVMYHYICFLCLADFWSRAENIRNINRTNKPIVVSDFIERIDNSISLSEVMDRTVKLGRQVIIVTK